MVKRITLLLIIICAGCFHIARGEAKAHILMELDSGRVLAEKNADQHLPIASTTKIMTCLIALEKCSLNELVTASENASGVTGTSIYLSVGETLTMEEMLYGLMLRSGNDAAVAIAEHIAGSTDAFSDIMNARAQEIGAEAYFTTPNGLDEGGNGASARGITLIAREAIRNEQFRNIVSTKKKTIPWPDHQYERVLTNKNRLLTGYEGAFGIKTGYTKKAGRCLVFAAEREGMTLIGAVLSCPDWFDEAERLMDEGFEAYDIKRIYKKDDIVKTVFVGGREIGIACTQDVKAPVKEGEKVESEISVEALDLPVYEGQIAGRIRLMIDGKCVDEIKLACVNTETKPTFINALRRVISLWTIGK